MIETMNCLIKHLFPELDVCWFEGRISHFLIKDWRNKTRWDTMHSSGGYSAGEYTICWSSTPWTSTIDTPDPIIKVLADSDGKWIGLKVFNARNVLHST